MKLLLKNNLLYLQLYGLIEQTIMQIRLGKSNSSLYQRSVRDFKAEQRHYFERLKRKTLDEQRPAKDTARNASKSHQDAILGTF